MSNINIAGLIKIIIYAVLGLIAIALVGAQVGLFAGRSPNDLGVSGGRLKAPANSRNSVSSQAMLYPAHPQLDYAQIAPLEFLDGNATASMQALVKVLSTMPGISLVRQQPDYLYAEARTPWLRFVDDLEFWVNPAAGVIEVRSASRLGREDFGVNRQRMESIRSAYLASAKK
ncbi:DUF1499 domain-containing protein [Dechloromonas sp. A34]|uniref:DUF1499 domain-containing protein n=1 Tax=Dechloromonas sp. A34 TaxID=447588 RepID=UPI002249569D|nr:DUF1499 domain-containing protein [Dechloromonas sp. A34]